MRKVLIPVKIPNGSYSVKISGEAESEAEIRFFDYEYKGKEIWDAEQAYLYVYNAFPDLLATLEKEDEDENEEWE